LSFCGDYTLLDEGSISFMSAVAPMQTLRWIALFHSPTMLPCGYRWSFRQAAAAARLRCATAGAV